MNDYSPNIPFPRPIDGIVWPPINDIFSNKMAILSNQIEESQWWSSEKILETQQKQLGALCILARATTPYYAETLKELPIDLETGVVIDDLKKLPILTRTDIQDRFKDLLCRNHSIERGTPAKFVTSGSTSSPVTIHISKTVSDIVTILQRRWYDWAGLDGNKRLGDLRSYFMGENPEKILKQKTWHYNFPDGENQKCNIAIPLQNKMDWFLDFKPNYLCTYPSVAKELMQYVSRNNIDISFVERIMTYGEAELKGLNKFTKDVCGATIFDKYSSREMGTMAIDCPHSDLKHIQTDNVLLEVIKDTGETAQEGEEGRIIVTNLLNTAMPLIRYEIGDRAVVGPKCSCGRGQPTLKSVLGRERNMFKLRDGTSYRSFTNLHDMETFSKIRQFIYIQTDYEDLIFRYVADEELNSDDLAAMRITIDDMFPIKFNVTYERVDEIPRNKGGKFEDMICEIKD